MHTVTFQEDGTHHVEHVGCDGPGYCPVSTDLALRPRDVKPIRAGVYRGVVDEDRQVVLYRMRNLGA